MKKSVFVFQQHTLLYDDQPAHWDIRVKANSHLEEWNIYEDPLMLPKGHFTQVRHKICRDLSWLDTEGRRKVDGIWTHVELLDKGPVLIDQKGTNKFLFNFQGSSLKGPWLLERKNGVWIFTRAGEQETTSFQNESRSEMKMSHSPAKCMDCPKPPTVEVLWAEGMAHAWFCDACFEKWKKQKNSMSDIGTNEGDINKVRKLPVNVASKRWSEGPPTKVMEK